MSKKIKWGLIGAGARGSCFAKSLLELSDNVELVKIYDPSVKSMDRISKMLDQEFNSCSDYKDIINDPDIDWVMVFSPNKEHAKHCLSALQAGKNIFLEKPPAITIEECLDIATAHETSGKILVPGFVLRYTPIWLKAYELINSGKYGKVISVNACENLRASHGSHIMMGWRRFKEISGSHILEKCSHSFDLLDWLIGSRARRVSSFADLNLFKPENADIREKFRDNDGKSPFDGWETALDDQPCPFKSEKSIIDNQVCALEYCNGVRVSYQATLANAIPEKRFYFSCSEGTVIVEYTEHKIRCCRYGEEVETFSFTDVDAHGGGDIRMCQHVVELMTGKKQACSDKDWLYGAIAAIALEQAQKNGEIINLESVWKKIDA